MRERAETRDSISSWRAQRSNQNPAAEGLWIASLRSQRRCRESPSLLAAARSAAAAAVHSPHQRSDMRESILDVVSFALERVWTIGSPKKRGNKVAICTCGPILASV